MLNLKKFKRNKKLVLANSSLRNSVIAFAVQLVIAEIKILNRNKQHSSRVIILFQVMLQILMRIQQNTLEYSKSCLLYTSRCV